MPETDQQEDTGGRSFNRRVISALPKLLAFAAMAYFSGFFFHDGLSLSRVPLWMRLPFFLYWGLTFFVGLIAVRGLFPAHRSPGSERTPRAEVTADANRDTLRPVETTTSGALIVAGLQVAFSILMFTCSATIFTLLVRSSQSFGTVGLAVFGVIAAVMLIAALKWPIRAINRKLKSGGPEAKSDPVKPLWKRIAVAGFASCIALIQTLAIGLYRDRISALVFAILCWLWASFHIWNLLRSRRAPAPHSD